MTSGFMIGTCPLITWPRIHSGQVPSPAAWWDRGVLMSEGDSLQFIQLSALSLLMTDRPQEREEMGMTGKTTLLQKTRKKIIKGEK